MTNADAKILLDACAKDLALWAEGVGNSEPDADYLMHRELLDVVTAVVGDGSQSDDPEIRNAFIKLLRALAYN